MNSSIKCTICKIRSIIPNIIITEKKKDYWYHFTIGKYNAYINRKKDGWEFDLVNPDERFYVNHKEASELSDKIQLEDLTQTIIKWHRVIEKELEMEE